MRAEKAQQSRFAALLGNVVVKSIVSLVRHQAVM